MELNEEAEIWVKNQVISAIVGYCCEIANKDPNRHKHSKIELRNLKSYIKIKFLLKNFSPILNVDTLVDDFYSKVSNDSQWNTDRNKNDFKSYVRMALEDVRDLKITDILK